MADRDVVSAELPNGVVIEVETVRKAGAQDVAAGRLDFDQVEGALIGLAELVKDAMVKVAPDKASVEFGMEMTVKEGRLTALLVSGGASASLKVTLEWERDSATDDSA